MSIPQTDSVSLAEFISYLNTNGMIDQTKFNASGDDGFENRLKAQQYVCIARTFGLDLGYKYTLRRHGPYSHRLAEDCQRLDGAVGGPPSGLRHDEFISVLRDKETDWLEIAATIIHEKMSNPNIRLKRFDGLAPDYTPEFIHSVYYVLRDLGLLKAATSSH